MASRISSRKPAPVKKKKKSPAKKSPRKSAPVKKKAPRKNKEGRGAPSKFGPEYCKHVYGLALIGLGLADIADRLGISPMTLRRWREKHPKFREALRDGTEKADQKVAGALYKRACGYSVKATKLFHHKGRVISKEYDEYFPPDVNAIKFWLTNRQPNTWKERRDVTSNGESLNVAVRPPDDRKSALDDAV